MNNTKFFGYTILVLLMLFTSCKSRRLQVHFSDLKNPKREFRGVWMHTIGQGQYQKMNSFQMKEYFVKQLDLFQGAGMNVVIFQVRPQADAFYYSEIEPWSRYLTGTQGVAPDNGFDPLQFLIGECHKRNMELHAWLNPYRVTSAEGQQLAPSHLYFKRPDLFVKYGTQMYFDPGMPENRKHISKVVKDIVQRYDVDAIHMDDYFYPYPIKGESFPDTESFLKYGVPQGFSYNQKDDWRRDNVNQLIKELKNTILLTKPWVRFGISPFGIYRNKKSTIDSSGSETNGLQNYDDLYADIKLWVKNGWIDYNIPQVYWEIGHKTADYKTLVNWWGQNNFSQHLYIGQDVKRTMDATGNDGGSQLAEKMMLTRSNPQISGNCFWSGYVLIENYAGSLDELKNIYHKYPALIPAYTHLYGKEPKEVMNLRQEYTQLSHLLNWDRNGDPADPENAQYYVVYRFDKNEKADISKTANIVEITKNTGIVLPYERGKNKYTYVVTSVDRFHNESKGKKIKITL